MFRSLLMALVVILTILLAAPLCPAEEPEELRYGRTFQERAAAQAPQAWSRAHSYCSPTRVSTLTPRPVAAPQPTAPGNETTLSRIVQVLELHNARLDAHDAQLGEINGKLDDLLMRQNGYSPVPSAPTIQPLLPTPPGAPGTFLPATPITPAMPQIMRSYPRPAAPPGSWGTFSQPVGWSRADLISLEKSLEVTSDPERRVTLRQAALQHPSFVSWTYQLERQLAAERVASR